MTLNVIAFEKACDFCVTTFNKMPYKLRTARLIIRTYRICAAERRVISVEKYYRYIHFYKFFIQIEIRIRHSRFCALYQYSVNGILEYFFKYRTLVANTVACCRKNSGVLVFG